MARDDPKGAKRQKRADEAATSRQKFGGKVHGPEIPGAEARPVVGKTKARPAKRDRTKKRTFGPAKDEVDRSERYTNSQAGAGISAHAAKMQRIGELKRLLQPLTPSLIQVMSDIAHDKNVHAAIRLDAADRLLNRQFGKPTERVELTDNDEDVATDEVKTLLNRVLESVGAPMLEFHDGGGELVEEEEDDASPNAG